MQLTDLLSARHVRVPLEAATRDAAIRELVDLLAASGEVDSAEAAMAALLERERTRTTGIGGGLALPHAKTPAARKLVLAVGKSPSGLDFQSVDGRSVSLVLLLLGPPDSTNPQIQALAKVSRIFSLDSMRKRLDAAATPEAVLKIIAEFEKQETS